MAAPRPQRRAPTYSGGTSPRDWLPDFAAAAPVTWGFVAVNVAVYLVCGVFPRLTDALAIVPSEVFHGRRLWSILTFQLDHANLNHILMNMLGVGMFGSAIERAWGSRFVGRLMAASAATSCLAVLLLPLIPIPALASGWHAETLGASGVDFGLMLAYAALFPNAKILLWFVVPMPARMFVALAALVTVYSGLAGVDGGVSHTGHFGGLVGAWLYLRFGGFSGFGGLFRRKPKPPERRFTVIDGGAGADDNIYHREACGV